MGGMAELVLWFIGSGIGGVVFGVALDRLVASDTPLSLEVLRSELVQVSVLVSLGLFSIAEFDRLLG